MLGQMLRDFSSSPELPVQNPEALEMLLDDKTLRIRSPFAVGERTAASVAQELGLALNTLLYQLKRLQRAGLLAVVRTERRSGKALKHYRAVAKGFFLPFDLTPSDTPEKLLAAGHSAWEERLVHSLVAAGRRLSMPKASGFLAYRRCLKGALGAQKHGAPRPRVEFLRPRRPGHRGLLASGRALGFC